MDHQLNAAQEFGTVGTVRVLLVHGTWARGFFRNVPSKPGEPRWFESGSPFSKQLFCALREFGLEPVLEDPFEWSGRNALLHRAEAAERLAKRLNEMPSQPCLVVGHSHGGNIVLKALDLVDDDVFARVRVMTLATPFVGLHWPEEGALNVERLQLTVFLFQLGFAIATIRWLFPDLPWWLPFALAFVPLLLSARLYYAMKDEAVAMNMRSRATCLAKRLYHGNRCEKFSMHPPHTLVLRGVEDEASLAISLAAAMGRFLQVARDVTYRLWHGGWKAVMMTAIVLSSLLGFAAAFDSLSAAGIVDGPFPTETLRAVGFIASLIAIAPPLVLGGLASVARALTGFSAGRELALLPNLEVSVATSPDAMAIPRLTGECGVTTTTLSRRGRPLPHIRHSIYDDPDVFNPIALWIGDAFAKTILDVRSGSRQNLQLKPEASKPSGSPP